jgi:hypothetical protein
MTTPELPAPLTVRQDQAERWWSALLKLVIEGDTIRVDLGGDNLVELQPIHGRKPRMSDERRTRLRRAILSRLSA